MDRVQRRSVLVILTVSAVWTLRAPAAPAQSFDPATGVIRVPPLPSARPLAFGTAAETLYQVPASGCSAVAGTALNADINGYFYKTSGVGFVDCPLNLPTGAIIDRFEALVYDAHDTSNVLALLGVCRQIDTAFACDGWGTVASSGTSGMPFTGYLQSDVSGVGLVVDKVSNLYWVRVVLQQPDTSNQFRQVNVYYRLQVSNPAPGTQTFGDVPSTHPYYRAIEALAASGITSGCGGGNFCPNQPVTRGEIAKFLANALGLHFPN